MTNCLLLEMKIQIEVGNCFIYVNEWFTLKIRFFNSSSILVHSLLAILEGYWGGGSHVQGLIDHNVMSCHIFVPVKNLNQGEFA